MVIPEVLTPDNDDKGCTDYSLAEGQSCWITVGQLSVYILPRDGALTVEVLPLGIEADAPINSMTVHDEDVVAFLSENGLLTDDEEEEEQEEGQPNRTPRPDELEPSNIKMLFVFYWKQGVILTSDMPRFEARRMVEEGKAYVIGSGHIGALNEKGEYDS